MKKIKYYLTHKDSKKIRIELIKRDIFYINDLTKMFSLSKAHFPSIINGREPCTQYFFDCMNELGIDVKSLCDFKIVEPKKPYYLTENDVINIKIEMLKLRIKNIKQLAIKIGYSQSNIASIFKGKNPYNKGVDEALKSIGINVIKIYDEEEQEND